MPRRRGLPWNKRGTWKVRTLWPFCTLCDSHIIPFAHCPGSNRARAQYHFPNPMNRIAPRQSTTSDDGILLLEQVHQHQILRPLTHYYRNTVTTKYDIQPALPAHVAIDLPAAIKSCRTELITRVLPITVAASDASVTKRLKILTRSRTLPLHPARKAALWLSLCMIIAWS